MKQSIKKGFSFGLTSGIITTLGLMVGLNASTQSKLVVIGGIIVIAVADSMSDALGIHISEESENQHTKKEVWESTIVAFLSKFTFALTFIIPILIFQLNTAIMVSIFWGLLLIITFSWYISAQQGTKAYKAIFEHLVLAVLVIIITNYVGKWIPTVFN